MTPADRWLTVAEGSEYARVSVWTLYRAISRNELYAGHARTRAIRLRAVDLDRWLVHSHRVPRAVASAKATVVSQNGTVATGLRNPQERA